MPAIFLGTVPRSRSRRRAVSALLVASLSAVACTLTASDFEPVSVTAGPARPDAPDAAPACSPPASCCLLDGDCREGELCSMGSCTALGVLIDVPDAAAVQPCSGTDCASSPASLEPSCDDNQRNGREAGIDCGGPCPQRCGIGSDCERAEDCSSLHCSEGRCLEATCDDQITNGDETAIDCGGSCERACGAGDGCRVDGDCAAGLFCLGDTSTCVIASCQDGLLNGNEILADCGGGDCGGCVDGTACGAASDCASRVCGDDGRCATATCNDGVQNSDEGGIDCGGSCDRSCLAVACTDDDDCNATRCAARDCAAGLARCCQLPACGDGLRNGTETGLDCGGRDADCPRCADGAGCAQGSDCASDLCSDAVCVSCSNDRRDGSETDIDCGGDLLACQRCEPGRLCAVDGDCTSGVCEGGRCCGGTLVDCTRCAERLSPNANCTDIVPAAQGSCIGFLQCLAANPGVCPTRYAPGCSSDPGGVCNHNTYGGDGGVGLQQANAIIFNAGCQF